MRCACAPRMHVLRICTRDAYLPLTCLPFTRAQRIERCETPLAIALTAVAFPACIVHSCTPLTICDAATPTSNLRLANLPTTVHEPYYRNDTPDTTFIHLPNCLQFLVLLLYGLIPNQALRFFVPYHIPNFAFPSHTLFLQHIPYDDDYFGCCRASRITY